MTFVDSSDYDRLDQDDVLVLENAREQLRSSSIITMKNLSKGYEFKVNTNLSPRGVEIILAGGLLNYTKEQNV